MGLIEEEDQLRFVEIPHLRKNIEQLFHEPDHERGVQLRIPCQFHSRQYVDDTASVRRSAHPIRDIQSGLAEEHVSAYILQGHHGPLYDAQGLRIEAAVLILVILPVLADEAYCGPQVLGVDKSP